MLNILNDWKTGVILPIYKKGNSMECGNYKGITSLSAGLKIYKSITEKRIRKIVEYAHSTQDYIFTIKIMIHYTYVFYTLIKYSIH